MTTNFAELKLVINIDMIQHYHDAIGDEDVTIGEIYNRMGPYAAFLAVTALSGFHDKEVRLWCLDCALAVYPVFQKDFPYDRMVYDTIMAGYDYAQAGGSMDVMEKRSRELHRACYTLKRPSGFSADAVMYATGDPICLGVNLSLDCSIRAGISKNHQVQLMLDRLG